MSAEHYDPAPGEVELRRVDDSHWWVLFEDGEAWLSAPDSVFVDAEQ